MMRVLSIMLVLLLSACGNAPSGVGTTATTTTTTTTTTTPTITVTPTTTPTKVTLASTAVSVKTDGADSAIITATVQDGAKVSVENATVSFVATGGQLSVATAITDAYGHASVGFSSGASRVNEVATITATVNATSPVVTGQIPIQLVGTTVALNSPKGALSAGVSDTLTVTVKDAYGQAVYNTAVSFAQTGAGSVNIYATAINTDINGKVVATVSSTTAGSVTVTVTAAGATATQSYTVSAGAALAITSPTTDPYDLVVGSSLPIIVTVPTGVASVTFATSIGVWNGGTASVLSINTGGAATVTANLSSTRAGVATVQVYDTANIASADSVSVALSQPAANASRILLQTNVSVLAPSTGGVTHSATLTATVLDAGGQVVGGAGVLFSIARGVGGGEKIDFPVVVLTNALGQAQATFSSGSVSTGAQGVDISAILISKTAINGTKTIVIGGQAASLTIGRSNLVSTLSNTEYSLPMSVMVADGNGNPAVNTLVTLSAFPKKFRIGVWANADKDPTVKKYFPCVTGSFVNEDTNRNVILDTGEDVVHITTGSSCDVYGNVTGIASTFALNTKLDPPSAAAGIVPNTVTTDNNGVANFNIVYLKANAPWIETEISASTQVIGTETRASITMPLVYLLTDGLAGILPNPTFGK